MSAEALAAPYAPALAERLDAEVRAEFRVEVLVPAVGDPILGSPACAVPGCVHSSRYAGLCPAHLGRWRKAGRPDRRAWAATADPEVIGHRPLRSCLVPECGFGQHRYRLCYKHSRAWDKAGRPAMQRWQPPIASPAAVCAVPGCVLWAELDAGWCHSHHTRWRQRGRPPAAEFIVYCASYGEDRFDLRALPAHLRREIQYALQCRVDANRTRTTPRSIKPLLDHLAASGVETLLERPLADWLTGLPPAAALHTPRAFLGYAIECLLDLRDGAGWDSEYQRDVWLLRRLGVAGHDGARLDFTTVQPLWLRELVKRWCRWRMSCGVGLQQLRKDRISLVRLSQLTPGLRRCPVERARAGRVRQSRSHSASRRTMPSAHRYTKSTPDKSRSANACCSAFQVSVSLVIVEADRPLVLPRNCPRAGTKSPDESTCRYSSGSTSPIFGVLRAHGGKIDDENRCRSPVSGSTRLSLTRGAVTSTAPALVVTVRDSWQPLRTTSR